MLAPEAFGSYGETARMLLAEARKVLDSGRGNSAYAMQMAFEEQLKLAEIALHAGATEADLRNAFEEATGWGMRWVMNEAPSMPLKIREIEVLVSRDGTFDEVSRQESSNLASVGTVSFDKFRTVLDCTVAFGTREQRQRVASVPERRYRSAGLIVPESEYQALAGFKATVCGQPSAAALFQRAIDSERHRPLRSLHTTGLALVERDWTKFETSLEESLEEYRKFYSSRPDHIEGVIHLHGMALCRLAIESGHQPHMRPYLPLYLLSNRSA